MHASPSSPGSAPAADAPLEVLHFGDLHLWLFRLEREFSFKRLLGLANLALRRARKFPPDISTALIQELTRAQGDWLLFSGDLTTTGLIREFEYGRKAFAPIFEACGDRFIAIPGNHDRYTSLAVEQKRFERLFLHQENFPQSVRLNDFWTLVNFDCSVPRLIRASGKLPENLQDDLIKRIDATDTPHVLLMGHYPLVYEASVRVRKGHALAESERESMAAKLRGTKVRAYLHGHEHRRWRVERDGIMHLNCGSAGMTGSKATRQPGYLRLILNADGSVDPFMHTYFDAQDQWRSEPLIQTSAK